MTFPEYLFIRTSFFYLFYAALTGVLFYLFPGLTPYLKTSHVHAGLVGFFLSMVMGVAYWMMPRPGGLRQDRLEALTYLLLNAGLLLRLILEPLHLLGYPLRLGLVVSGLLQLGAVGVFAYAMQRRVYTSEMLRALREKRERSREVDRGIP